jgi:integrase
MKWPTSQKPFHTCFLGILNKARGISPHAHSTTLNKHGAFDSDVIEAALAHIDKNEVRRAYNRAEYIKRRREMMNWWSNHIQDACTGNFSLASSSNKGI